MLRPFNYPPDSTYICLASFHHDLNSTYVKFPTYACVNNWTNEEKMDSPPIFLNPFFFYSVLRFAFVATLPYHL